MNEFDSSIREMVSDDVRYPIDNYAREKLACDPQLSMAVSVDMRYKLEKVNHRCPRFKFQGLGNVTQSSMVGCIVELCDVMSFKQGFSNITYDDVGVRRVPECVLKFVKSLLLCQVSKSLRFSSIVARYAEELVESLKYGISFPVVVKCSSKFDETIVEELNAFYEYLLTSNNVEYSEEVPDAPKRKQKKKKPNEDSLSNLIRMAGEEVDND